MRSTARLTLRRCRPRRTGEPPGVPAERIAALYGAYRALLAAPPAPRRRRSGSAGTQGGAGRGRAGAGGAAAAASIRTGDREFMMPPTSPPPRNSNGGARPACTGCTTGPWFQAGGAAPASRQFRSVAAAGQCYSSRDISPPCSHGCAAGQGGSEPGRAARSRRRPIRRTTSAISAWRCRATPISQLNAAAPRPAGAPGADRAALGLGRDGLTPAEIAQLPRLP